MTGYVFKVQANLDPNHRDRVAFVRLCSGRFRRGMRLKHVRSGRALAVNNPIFFFARERDLAEEAYPGDIIGIPNHGTLRVGDALCEGDDVRFTGLPNFAPEVLRRIRLDDPIRGTTREGVPLHPEPGAAQESGRVLIRECDERMQGADRIPARGQRRKHLRAQRSAQVEHGHRGRQRGGSHRLGNRGDRMVGNGDEEDGIGMGRGVDGRSIARGWLGPGEQGMRWREIGPSNEGQLPDGVLPLQRRTEGQSGTPGPDDLEMADRLRHRRESAPPAAASGGRAARRGSSPGE